MNRYSNDYDMWTCDKFFTRERNIKIKRPPTPKGCYPISDAKPKTYQYHYSNENSQGALICETRSFPSFYNPELQDYHSAYQDRLAEWDYDNYKKICEFVGGSWEYKLQSFSDGRLKEFAQLVFKLDKLPNHVRVVYYYNISNGYSCPTVECIIDKD